ncbi:MAG: type II secretion system protein N [Pseudomonadota bacterium]
MNLGARLRGLPVRPRTLLMLTEVVLVALLGVQAARLVWALAAPPQAPAESGPAPSARPADTAILAQFDPFFRGLGEGLVEATDASLASDLQLYGVRVGAQPSAILGPPGGEQALYGLGQALPGGQVLSAVAADHVVLSAGGVRQRLNFPVLASGALPPPPPPPAGGSSDGAAAYSGAQLAAALALTPRLREGRPAGYVVAPRGAQGAAVLARSGLAPGDVILTVDGSELNRERFSELPAILAAADRVEITYERAGQTLTTTLRMSPP